MAKSNIITALDVGTSNVKVLVVEQKTEESEFEVLALIQEPVFGVRKGVVIDTDKVSKVIQIAVDKAQREIEQKIKSVYVNIGGIHIFTSSSYGTVAVSRADRNISEEDVNRVLQAAQTFSLPLNKEILQVFPKEFIVDGEKGIKEVVGMQGTRLEAEVLVLGGFAPYIKNLKKSVLDANLQISDIVPSPIASAKSVLSQKQKELGVALLEIGAGTSGLVVFEEGELVHLAIFPIGGASITNDIAVGLKTDVDVAERIKIEFGTCSLKGGDKKATLRSKEKIETEEAEPLVFSHKQLANIINARVSEIFSEVQKELKKISKQGLLPAGVVLTGGGVKLPKITELAKKEMKLSCKIGRPSGFSGLEEDPIFSTLSGLILTGADLEGERGWSGGGKLPIIGAGFGTKFKKIFKIFIP